MKSNYTYKNGIHDGLPIAFGYLCVSIGFGIAAVNWGIPTLTTVIISLTNLTSAGQLAGAKVIATGGAITEMIAVQLTINCRYALMGISLSQKLDNSFNTKKRLLTSFFITDEIFSVASIKQGKIGVKYFLGLATTPYFAWAFGTLIGAVAGEFLPVDLRLSLGIAIYGMFIAIIVPVSKTDKGTLIAVIFSAILSTAIYFIPIFDFISDGFSIIISSIIGAIIASIIKPVKEDEEDDYEY